MSRIKRKYLDFDVYTQNEVTTISGDIVVQIPSLSGYATEAYVTTVSGDIVSQIVASGIATDTAGFDGLLAVTDDTIQKALDTLDDHTHPFEDSISTAVLGTPTYSTLADWFKLSQSPGRISGGSITDNGDGTFSVSAGTGWIKKVDSDTAALFFMDWAASENIALATDEILFVGVQYSAGTNTAVVVTQATDGWDLDTEFPLGEIINEGDVVTAVNDPWWTGDAVCNIIERIQADGRLIRDEYAGGLALSATSTRNVAVTAGTLWARLNEFPFEAFDSSNGTDKFITFYRKAAGAGWNLTTNVSQYPVLQYDDGSGTLQNIGNNQYANWWVFVTSGGMVELVYPQNTYSSVAPAEAEEIPSDLPDSCLLAGRLVGRILFKQGTDAPVAVQSAFTTVFTPAQSADHGNLSGLSGDDHTQYILTDGTRSFTGTVSGVEPTADAHLATKYYVDYEISTISGGGATSHGALTGLENDDHTQYVLVDGSRGFTDVFEVVGITFTEGDVQFSSELSSDGDISGLTFSGTVSGTNGQALYVDSSGAWSLAKADDKGTIPATALVVNNNKAITYGYIRNDAWNWTPGGAVYVSDDSAGDLTQTAPTASGSIVQVVGVAITSDVMFFNPDYTYLELGSPPFYTKEELTTSGVLDVRYYTEDEVDVLIASASGTTDHSALNNLDYASSGHTGFVSSSMLTTTSGDIVAQIITDHGGLSGLGDDDHTQYPHKVGWDEAVTTQITLSFDAGTRTVTVAPTGESFSYWAGGVQYTKSEAQTVTITDTEGIWYIYFLGATLTASQTSWSFTTQTQALAVLLYWDAANNVAVVFGWEAHGWRMDRATHAYLHRTIGTRWESGVGVSINGANLDIASGYIHDEDIRIYIEDSAAGGLWQQDLTPASLPILYRTGAAGLWRKVTASTTPVYLDTNVPQVNIYDAGEWKWDPVDVNRYFVYWVIASCDISEPVFLVPGQEESDSLTTTRDGNVLADMTFGSLPTAEHKVLARVILQRSNAAPYYTLVELQDYRQVSDVPSSGAAFAGDHGALIGLGDDDHTQYLRVDGSRGLSAVWDAGSWQIRAETFQSDVETGTAPFTAASITLVTNFNADLLDGNHAAAFEPVLGNPDSDGHVLSSTVSGVRSWVPTSSGSGGVCVLEMQVFL